MPKRDPLPVLEVHRPLNLFIGERYTRSGQIRGDRARGLSLYPGGELARRDDHHQRRVWVQPARCRELVVGGPPLGGKVGGTNIGD